MKKAFTYFITFTAMFGMHSQSYAKCKKPQKDDSIKLAAKIESMLDVTNVGNLDEDISKLDNFLDKTKSNNQRAHVLLQKARVYELHGQTEVTLGLYKEILQLDDVSYETKLKVHKKTIASKHTRNAAAHSVKKVRPYPAGIPSRALKYGYSGKCNFIFDVDETGKPINIDIFLCTDNVFERSTQKALEKWKYEIPVQGGLPTVATGIVSSMSFMITDKKGRKCPLKVYSS